ncbi:hypothetical protein [Spirillospora sp. CA-294931]|uniref:hypothetical protein n=1 Tax=Spirillospora sp. CA-294931 TaxID=3240042 RepID=UPI003D8CFA46
MSRTSRKLGADAFLAAIPRKRIPQTPQSRRRIIFGAVLVSFVLSILVVMFAYTLAYAGWGPGSLPGLVNRGGRSGPAPLGDRLGAMFFHICLWILLILFIRQVIRHRLVAPKVAIDQNGVWLTRGRMIQQGLPWAEIAAVNVVGPGAQTRIGPEAASTPFIEVFPVNRAEETGTPLSARLVNAHPTAPGLRGKRYVIELLEPPPQELTATLNRFAREKHLVA